MQKRLRLLLVSDPHLALARVREAGERAGEEDVDAVVCTGDLACYAAGEGGEGEAEEGARAVLELLANKHGKIVYWIPGNHDAPTCFTLQTLTLQMGRQFVALHGKSRHAIAPGLNVAALGGAVPGYCNGNLVWAGYPYQSNDELAAELASVWSGGEPRTPGEQWLLLTHCGPAGCSTTLARHIPSEAPIESGSAAIANLIQENHEHIPLAIHGHTHMSWGMAQIGKTSIVNPGALQEGRFAHVELVNGDEGWKLEAVRFLKTKN